MYSCSLDKIKLNIQFKRFVNAPRDVDSLRSILLSDIARINSNFFVKEEYRSNNKFKYAYAYKILPKHSDEGVVFLSLCYNGGMTNSSDKYKGILEFNPSKCGIEFFRSLFSFFDFSVVRIISFDIAFDVPDVDVNSCSFMIRNERVMSIGSFVNRSWYISPSTRDGRVKVYQKDAERKLHDVEIGKTLRIEISMDFPQIFFGSLNDSSFDVLKRYVDKLNSVYWLVSDDVTLLLLSSVDEEIRARALALMDYRARKKYRELLKSCSLNLNLDLVQFSVLLLDLLKDFIKGGQYVYADCLSSL